MNYVACLSSCVRLGIGSLVARASCGNDRLESSHWWYVYSSIVYSTRLGLHVATSLLSSKLFFIKAQKKYTDNTCMVIIHAVNYFVMSE